MEILSIGNSFSQDAQRYLADIARADGFSLNSFNLYIGGCSLATHYRNMLSEKPCYELEMNGHGTGFNVSLKEALLNREWDIVTLQQVSHLAPYYETYTPYLSELARYVKQCVPKAKIVLHQTWGYEQGSERLCKELGYKNYSDMQKDISLAYKCAAADINANGTIPSGELFAELKAAGAEKIYRDTFHASLGLARYALALLWYRYLTGKSVKENSFSDFDEYISQNEIDIAKKCVSDICESITYRCDVD